jgi:hypothetical protein
MQESSGISSGRGTDDGWTIDDFRSVGGACEIPVETMIEVAPADFVLIGAPGAAPDPEASPTALPFRVTRRYTALGMTEVTFDLGVVAGDDAYRREEWTGEAARDRLIELTPGAVGGAQVFARSAAWRSVAIGIDHLIKLAVGLREGGPNLIGGREAGVPGYPALIGEPGSWQVVPDQSLDWAAGSLIVPTLNLSCGPPTPRFPLTGHDLGYLAIELAAAQDILVVVAAGNCGRLGNDSIQAWARIESVVSVGATDDAEGTSLAEYSGRGIPEDPSSGPDVVAYGASQLDDRVRGTSFAAPRVSALANLIVAALLQLRRELLVAKGADEHGVPLVGRATVDDFGTEIWGIAGRQLDIPALPLAGVNRDAVIRAQQVADKAGVTLRLTGTRELLRRLLVSFARPMPGYEPHEAGAGFLDLGIVLDGLAALSAWDLFGWAADEPPSEHHSLRVELDALKLFDPLTLPALADVVAMSSVNLVYDRLTQRYAWQPWRDGLPSDLPLDVRLNGAKVP